MGITINIKDMYIDCGYGSFKFLRDKIAECISKEFLELYTKPEKDGAYFMFDKEKKKRYFQEHSAKMHEYCKKNKIPKRVLYALWMPDVEGYFTPTQSKYILEYMRKANIKEFFIGYQFERKSVFYFMKMLEVSAIEKKYVKWA